jgi:ATP-grasp domain, R2K clade family 3
MTGRKIRYRPKQSVNDGIRFARDHLFYDDRDDHAHEARGSRILYWLDDLGAKPLAEARPESRGFLFAGARPIADYARLVHNYPLIRDWPEERSPLLQLDSTLEALAAAGVNVPTPRTWRLALDAPLPADLAFPLFVRAAHTSLKLGGRISRVRGPDELETEAAELRRVLGWDALLLAREWHELAEAGHGMYGPIPQEMRVWVVDGEPYAWSFHYLNVLPTPAGFPPSAGDLRTLADLARLVGSAFQSRCVVADFARETRGGWLFIEAGPGSCAGTAHEGVFKAVAARLGGGQLPFRPDAVGGLFESE